MGWPEAVVTCVVTTMTVGMIAFLFWIHRDD